MTFATELVSNPKRLFILPQANEKFVLEGITFGTHRIGIYEFVTVADCSLMGSILNEGIHPCLEFLVTVTREANDFGRHNGKTLICSVHPLETNVENFTDYLFSKISLTFLK